MTEVVIVEDEHDISFLISMMVDGSPGLSVVGVFERVTHAMRFKGWEDVDVAVIDWSMPENNGGVLAEWLRRNHPHVRRVLATALNREGTLIGEVETSLFDVALTKPFTTEELVVACG